ncbi:hypothetical protein PUN28_013342 [Cardiocondyla obscurior]|uniref:Uncharacterized protein n=1 Tax=Cardiocondyla obscurior TaxID=286306 RepID=A0AAW2F803_9HYME
MNAHGTGTRVAREINHGTIQENPARYRIIPSKKDPTPIEEVIRLVFRSSSKYDNVLSRDYLCPSYFKKRDVDLLPVFFLRIRSRICRYRKIKVLLDSQKDSSSLVRVPVDLESLVGLGGLGLPLGVDKRLR